MPRMKERDDTGMKIETAVERLHEEIEELLAKEAAFYRGRELKRSPSPGKTPLPLPPAVPEVI